MSSTAELLDGIRMPVDYSDEIRIPASDGMTLAARCWSVPQPRGVVVVSHGLGEHGGAYAHLAEAIGREVNFDFVALDLRGHGRSPGRRGVVREYDELTRDLQSGVTWVRKHRDGLPSFLLGHCAGGQVAIRVAHQNRGEIAGVIASNPMIRIGMPVPPGKAKLGKLLAKLAPWVTLNADLPVEGMTRDPLMLEHYRTDKLRHKRISPPLYFGLVDGGETLLHKAREIQTPMLLLVGGQDPVLSTASTHEFFDRVGSGDKTLSLYPEMLHEPFNELGRERVFDDRARWLEPRGLAP